MRALIAATLDLVDLAQSLVDLVNFVLLLRDCSHDAAVPRCAPQVLPTAALTAANRPTSRWRDTPVELSRSDAEAN